MKRVDGWMVIADISGYTAFLTQTALEHAQAIVEELLKGLHRNLSAPLQVIKLEGDAVLACAPADSIDGDALVTRLLALYRAFRFHVLSIERCTTCGCDGCRAAAMLDLKLIVHRGEYVQQQVGNVTDLQGASVILAHRLLKNHVVETTGFPAYLLVTDAVQLSGDLAARFVSHTETYEHFGTAECRVLDLHGALERNFGEHTVRVERDDVVAQYDLPVPVEDAWAWHFDARRRREWDDATAGEMRLGGAVECTHTDGCRVHMQIVDWRPFRYVTLENAPIPLGRKWYPATRATVDFEPSETGTRVTHRIQVQQRGLLGWIVRNFMVGELTRDTQSTSNQLVSHLAG